VSLRSGRAMSGYVRLALSPSPPDGLAPGSLVNAGVTLFSPSPRRASPPPGKGAYGQNSNVGPPPIQASFANVAGAAMPSVRKAMPIHCKNRHRGCTRAALIAVAALPRDNVERGSASTPFRDGCQRSRWNVCELRCQPGASRSGEFT